MPEAIPATGAYSPAGGTMFAAKLPDPGATNPAGTGVMVVAPFEVTMYPGGAGISAPMPAMGV